MNKPDYVELRERVRTICNKDKRQIEFNALMDRAEKECSPQQKGGLYRIVRQRAEDAEYQDMYYPQF
jgi:hypothetical protein